jgi:hypothetical protein
MKFNFPTVATALARVFNEKQRKKWEYNLKCRELCTVLQQEPCASVSIEYICKVSQFLKEIEVSGKDRALVGVRRRHDGDASIYVYAFTKRNHTDTDIDISYHILYCVW